MKTCKFCKENYNWPNCKNCFKNPNIKEIDAGMNELNNYGTMHNRVRMICGSYLVKN